jgi:hypothetical protein
MDIIDLWWNASQQASISELRTSIGATRTSSNTLIARQTEMIRLLQQENEDMRLRVGVLIRLLIQQGALSAEQYATALNEAKAQLELTKPQSQPARKPTAVPRARPQ